MNLINELRMLAEDLHVNGYNRYSVAMSKAADELGPLERYRTAYNEWVDKTEWVQADTSLPAKYLGMHRADVLKDKISELEERCAKWEAVFGHLGGTPDECGNAIIAARDELEERCATITDALLIAAAPDLLEALQNIAEYWNQDQNEAAMADACWHAIHTARAAIAKATGEQP